MSENDALMVSLNNVAAVVESLKTGALRELVVDSLAARVADCDTHCDCKNIYCGCNNIVSARFTDTLSFEQFAQQREAKLQELKAQIRALDIPADFKGKG